MCTISCLIVGYNEGERVRPVLSVVEEMNVFDKIFFVNDGSTDNTEEIVRSYSSRIQLINLEDNLGKSEAIQKSVRYIKSDYIFLFDADLKHILRDELENAIRLTLEKKLDLTILRKKSSILTLRLSRMDIILSGTIIIKRDDLLKINKMKPRGYELEVIRNQYIMESHKKAHWYFISAGHYYKTEKIGVLLGFISEINMYYRILLRIGVMKLIKQMLFFCRGELEK